MIASLDRWLFGVGFGLISVAQVVPLIDDRWSQLTKWAAILGLVLIATGAAAYIWARRPGIWETTYYVRSCRDDEAHAAHALMVKLLGSEIGSLQLMKSWMKHDNRCIQLLYRQRQRGFDRSVTLFGFFSLFELSLEATEKMQLNELSGLGLSANHICDPKSCGKSLYVGAIGALGRRCRAELLRHLNAHLIQRANDHIKVVLTRPVANAAGKYESMRAINRHGFAPVISDQPLGTVNYMRLLTSEI